MSLLRRIFSTSETPDAPSAAAPAPVSDEKVPARGNAPMASVPDGPLLSREPLGLEDLLPPGSPAGQFVQRLASAVSTLVLRHVDLATDTEQRPASDARVLGERWAGHLQEGIPAPGPGRTTLGTSDDGTVERLPLQARDWQGALNWLARDQAQEREQAVRTRQALEETIMLLMTQMYQGVLDEKGEVRETELQMERMRSSLATTRIDDLKREVYGTVQFMSRINEQRRERREQHVSELSRRLRQIRDELEIAQRQAETDPLTGVLNRAGMEKVLEQTAKMHVLTGQKACMLVIDLDHFKQVNDRLGHPEGDRLLCQVARVLVKAFPRKGDMIARYGGDEFVVILPETKEADAVSLAERVMTIMSAEDWKLGQDLTIGFSIGLAEIDPVDRPADWLGRADHALLRAKREGRGRVLTAGQVAAERNMKKAPGARVA